MSLGLVGTYSSSSSDNLDLLTRITANVRKHKPRLLAPILIHVIYRYSNWANLKQNLWHKCLPFPFCCLYPLLTATFLSCSSIFSTSSFSFPTSNTRRSLGVVWVPIRVQNFPEILPNPSAKFTVVFEGKYLKNGAFHGQSYSKTLTANDRRPNEWQPLHWPWVTPIPQFQFTAFLQLNVWPHLWQTRVGRVC